MMFAEVSIRLRNLQENTSDKSKPLLDTAMEEIQNNQGLLSGSAVNDYIVHALEDLKIFLDIILNLIEANALGLDEELCVIQHGLPRLLLATQPDCIPPDHLTVHPFYYAPARREQK
jgi:hypothetical protein